FKPLGRLAFLALALEIEDEALKLCQFSSIAEACWQSLSEGRRSKAIDQFKLNHQREPNLEDDNSRLFEIMRLIECTQLSDKASMIWKQKLITSDTRTYLLGFFEKLRSLRDKCAHPGTNRVLLPKGDLVQFINSANRIRSSFRELMETRF